MNRTLRAAVASAATLLLIAGVPVSSALAQTRAALVQNVDEPGRNVFTLRTDVSTGGFVSFPVPAGKRYVIDQYTGDCGTPNTTSIIDVELVTTSDGVVGFFHTPVHYTENVGFGLVRYAGTGQGPFYADAGTSITLVANSATGNSTDFRGCSFVITGHVINNP